MQKLIILIYYDYGNSDCGQHSHKLLRQGILLSTDRQKILTLNVLLFETKQVKERRVC